MDKAIEAAARIIDPLAFEEPENRLLAMTKERDALRERLAEAEKMIAGKDDHFMNAHLRAHMVVLCDENDALRERLATSYAESHLTRAIDFIKKAGHLPRCGRRKHCAVCNAPPFAFTHSTNRADSHPYKEGPCTCGHDRIVGSEGE